MLLIFFFCREFGGGKVVRGRARVELSSKVLDVVLGEPSRGEAVKAAQGFNLRLLGLCLAVFLAVGELRTDRTVQLWGRRGQYRCIGFVFAFAFAFVFARSALLALFEGAEP